MSKEGTINELLIQIGGRINDEGSRINNAM